MATWKRQMNDLPSKMELDKAIASFSLFNFIKEAWHVLEYGRELKIGWPIEAMCEHLQAVTDGELNRLLINIPPGSSKSLTVGVFWPAFEWIKDPTKRFIGTSHNQNLAIRDNRKCRTLIESSWYQELFGTHFKLTGDQNAKGKFENDKSGFRESMAFESMTGSRADTVILDDPHSVSDAASSKKLASAIETFNEALPTRLSDPKNSSIVVVMQRLNEGDVSGEILSRDLGYEHLCIPMEFEPERKCYTSIGWEDPRQIEGELFFPTRFSAEVVERDKKVMGSHATAGQFQQRPAQRGGNIFKEEWFKYWSVEPLIKHRTIYADTASKTATHNDYSVFQCWGKTENNQAILLDQVRGKWEAPELKVKARAFWNKHKDIKNGPLRAMKVEDKSSGTGLIQELKREGIPIIPIPRNTDKIERAYDVTPAMESGNVFLPQSSEWLSDFLKEATAFPAGNHDDQLDPMMDAISDIMLKVEKSYSIRTL